jgi:2-hydroxychromene-2-carboxylate isomerase
MNSTCALGLRNSDNTMKNFDFYFDFGSPASWLAHTQISTLCAATGATVNWKPMLLGGVFAATGNHSPVTIPAKGQYVFKDFARFAKRYGVPLNPNPHFPINTLTLMRIVAGLQMNDDARFAPYMEAVYRAIWQDAKNMNDPAVVAEVLQAAGFDAAELMALAADPAVKEALKLQTQTAVERGVFGAPTFFVGSQMFWGQDRIDFVREALLETA